MTRGNGGRVRRRRVFYIPGYDPFPPRRYRELYRTESQDQAELSGYEISVQGKPGAPLYGWRVNARIQGQQIQADIDVLVWSDIVANSMASGIAATYWQLLRTVWTYGATGALRRMMWLRKGPVIAAFYPVGMLLLQMLLAVLGGLGAAWILTTALGGMQWVVGVPHNGFANGATTILAGIAGLMSGVWILQWFKQKDHRFFAYYLMHDYAFSARYRGEYPPALEQRMTEFGREIRAALASDVDEVLVVGHSSGAHLAISIVADILRDQTGHPDAPALGLLTLGQVVPMVSFLPRAQRLRADLHDLARSDALSWVDVSAPGDGCSFALCDPVAVSGVAPADKRWPLVFSAAFSKSLSPQRWKNLRRRYFRLHFQYLCAFDRPLDYDYFQITAGPQTLRDRYGTRLASKSRIDVAASGYTNTT